MGMLALFFAMIALMSWSVSSPVAASPDEGYHLATIWCANGPSDGHCEYKGEGSNISRFVPEAVYNWCYQHKPNKSASCTSQVNQENLVNATRSAEASTWFRFLEIFSGEPVATHVIMIRIVSSTLTLLVIALAYLISNRRHRIALVLAGGLLFMPHGIYLISASHPSGTVTALATIAIALINQLINKSMEGKSVRVALVLLGVSMFLLYDIRKEVFGYVLFVTLLITTIRWNSTSEKSNKIKSITVTGGLLLLAISVLLLQKFAPSSLPLTLNVWGDGIDQSRSESYVLITNFLNFPSLFIGNFGYWGLGALDTPIPMLVWILTTCSITAVIALSLYFSPKSNIVFFSLMSIFVIWLVLQILQSSKLYVGEEMQPRYILPLVAMFFVTLIANSAVKRPEPANLNFLVMLVVSFASTSNSISLWTTLRRYTSGLDSAEFDLNFNREWWWDFALDPNQVWAIGTIAFGSAFCIALIHSLASFEETKKKVLTTTN